jgi:hypothetical protein
MVRITLLPKFIDVGDSPSSGEESDGWHFGVSKANFCDQHQIVISIKYGVEFCDQRHIP